MEDKKEFFPFKLPPPVYNKERLVSDEKYE